MGEMSEALFVQNYHPVLILGGKGVGKTVLIQSLIAYLRSSQNDASVILGQNPLPGSFPDRSKRVEDAEYFFGEGLRRWGLGYPPERTTKEYPFFVPIEIRKANDDSLPQRLALFDGMGEWTQWSLDDAVLPDFKTEIRDVLVDYPAGISTIFIVPAQTKRQERSNQRDIDFSMSRLIDQYHLVRGAPRDNDRLLLLISKWDLLCANKTELGNWLRGNQVKAFREKVVTAISPYSQTWSAFSSVTGNTDLTLNAMPHTAASIADKEQAISYDHGQNEEFPNGQILENPADRHLLVAQSRYNKILANWLYGNSSEEGQQRTELFPEVALKSVGLKRNFERLLYGLILARRQLKLDA